MGGIEGRAYYGYNNALQNTKDRYYQKYVKPVLDRDVDPLEQVAGVAGGIGNLATGGNPITGYREGKDVYNIIKAVSSSRPAGYHPALDKPPRWM